MRQKAAIRVTDAEAGRFPDICIKTGTPAKSTKQKTFTSAPDWTWLLLLLGFLPWLFSIFASSRSIVVQLPVADQAERLGKVTGRIDGPWLWLGGVDKRFARELGRMYADLSNDELPSGGRR
ncbi:MAG: hypothetical protein GY788_15705 [bacterium]|nr:hypothetical protein [bacterium]